MLYVSLVPAAILLLAAHRAARPVPRPVGWVAFLGWGFAVTFFPCGFMFTSPVVWGLCGLLVVALGLWHLTRRRARYFFPYSVTALVLAYGVASWYAARDYLRFEELRNEFPLVSMADRVPEPRRAEPVVELTGPVADGLTLLEKETRVMAFSRGYALDVLHARTVEAFVNSPGFGVARTIPLPSERSIRQLPERPDPPPQPESPGVPWEGSGFMGSVSGEQRKDLGGMHLNGLLDFVNAEGWGYVRSRREVAGFLPHAFSRVPEAAMWKVVRVELVGLLKHAEPVVYPSDRLPAMADLKDAPSRVPDGFEAEGVAVIRRGEDGFAGRRGDEVRYVGAIRSAASCVGCHGGQRGDLLGAFSYRLRPARR